MRVLICDDDQEALNALNTHIREYMQNRFINCTVTATTNPLEILATHEPFDLAFLDIEMGSIDGLTLAKELKQRNGKLALFFVTNYDEYQDSAMDLQALRFFSKPFDVKRLHAGLDRAMEFIDGAYVDVYLYGENSQIRVLVDDIMYLTSSNRKALLYTKNSCYPIREGFDAWCEKLPPLFFYQVHKSFYVNLHYVQKYSYSELLLTNGTRIPIAPRRQADFHKFWFAYLRRR